jgi:hypothetical protein
MSEKTEEAFGEMWEAAKKLREKQPTHGEVAA